MVKFPNGISITKREQIICILIILPIFLYHHISPSFQAHLYVGGFYDKHNQIYYPAAIRKFNDILEKMYNDKMYLSLLLPTELSEKTKLSKIITTNTPKEGVIATGTPAVFKNGCFKYKILYRVKTLNKGQIDYGRFQIKLASKGAVITEALLKEDDQDKNANKKLHIGYFDIKSNSEYEQGEIKFYKYKDIGLDILDFRIRPTFCKRSSI
jgi:hypothetical protein